MLFRALGIACAVVIWTAAMPAHATISMLVSPSEINIEARAGESVARTVKMYNNGNAPFQATSYAWEWWYDDANRKLFAPIGTFPRQAANWITITPSVVKLDPSKWAEVRITVAVPPEAHGGFFAVAFFEVTPPPPPGMEQQFLKAGVGLGARLGVLIEVRSRGKDNAPTDKLTVNSIDVNPSTASEPLRVKVHATNTGDLMQKPTGIVALIESGSQRMRGKVDLQQLRMLPGQKGVLEGAYIGNLPPGKYTAVVTLNFGGNQISVARAEFTIAGS